MKTSTLKDLQATKNKISALSKRQEKILDELYERYNIKKSIQKDWLFDYCFNHGDQFALSEIEKFIK